MNGAYILRPPFITSILLENMLCDLLCYEGCHYGGRLIFVIGADKISMCSSEPEEAEANVLDFVCAADAEKEQWLHSRLY